MTHFRRTLLSVLSGTMALPADAQTAVAVRDLGAVSAKTTEHIKTFLGLWQFSDGTVLIDDGGARRLLLFDSTLTLTTIVADTSRAALMPYGRMISPLVPYAADSVFFPDLASGTLLLIGKDGRVIRSVAPPKSADMLFLRSSAAGADPRGRLLYRGIIGSPPVPPGAPRPPLIDSAPIVRADFETRTVDTVAKLRTAPQRRAIQMRGADDKVTFKDIVDPITIVDAWALHADGTVAVLRGRDYHIDWIGADGVMTSSPRMPFDWRRLTDDDKRKLIDSLRTAYDTLPLANRAFTIGEAVAQNLSRESLRIEKAADGSEVVPIVREYVPIDSIPDYYPAIRGGAMKADMDGNLWILPATSAQSRKGGLVYDIVNRRGELYERVELPVGRSIAGFGKGGVVYLMSGDLRNGFAIERARMH